jgi:hypothetical protein
MTQTHIAYLVLWFLNDFIQPLMIMWLGQRALPTTVEFSFYSFSLNYTERKPRTQIMAWMRWKEYLSDSEGGQLTDGSIWHLRYGALWL